VSHNKVVVVVFFICTSAPPPPIEDLGIGGEGGSPKRLFAWGNCVGTFNLLINSEEGNVSAR